MVERGAREAAIPGQTSGDGAARRIAAIREELGKTIVGQQEVVSLVLAALLAEGHVLLVGVPGLAKTMLIETLARLLGLESKRIQFTPDLMPSDITGATLIRTDSGGDRGFHFLSGPIFANLILADEINRTPPKTQAALMEAMEERQVTVSGARLALPSPFFVLATQNPIEQQGTYPLPISQLDRFLLMILVDYPSQDEEFRVVLRTTSAYTPLMTPVADRSTMIEWIAQARKITVPAPILEYASSIVRRTRPDDAGAPEIVKESLAWGAGPRAVQSLLAAGRSLAFMDGRGEVTFDDIHRVAHPSLRHRLVLNYHAQAEGTSADDVVDGALVSLGRYVKPAAEGPPPKESGLRARLRSWRDKLRGRDPKVRS